MAPTVKATLGAQTSPLPQSCPEHPACRQGRGRVSSGRAGSGCRTSQCGCGCATLLPLCGHWLGAHGVSGAACTIAAGWGAGETPPSGPDHWHLARGGRGGDAAEERFVRRCTLRPCLQRYCVILLPWTRLAVSHHMQSPPNSSAQMLLHLQGGSFCSHNVPLF